MNEAINVRVVDMTDTCEIIGCNSEAVGTYQTDGYIVNACENHAN
jgi:hypothetical protein